jgi:glycolate dehydrogenase iron-sulfur subunit
MRTLFSPEQLKNPDTREVERILRKCVHCGFCNATCPTFLLKGDELDGPRGRIYLIKDMLENESRPDKEVVLHIDRCLSCLSCMTTCPSGVDYMHLIDHGRAYISKHHNRNYVDGFIRHVLAFVLPSPVKFRWLMKIAGLAQPVANLLPASIASGIRLAKQSQIELRQSPFKTIYKSDVKSLGNVGLLPGCAQQVVANEINMASIRLLNRVGYDVHVLSESECCGAIEHHLGKDMQSLDRVKANLRNWSDILPDMNAFISNASGCGTMMKDYAHLLKNDNEFYTLAKQLSDKTLDICEFLKQQELNIEHKNLGKTYSVAYQNPCSMQHGQKVAEQPKQLLNQFGFNATLIPDSHLCCGSAGTYNILQPDLAKQLGQKKAITIESVSPDVIASGNLGCILQLRQYTTIPVLHTVQLLDWASGGPKPVPLVSLN